MNQSKSISEIFSQFSDSLQPWRKFVASPHRLPEAVRYFLSQQVTDLEVLKSLNATPPQHSYFGIVLLFADHSLLHHPADLFTDEASYQLVWEQPQKLEWLLGLKQSIAELSATAFDHCFYEAVRILTSLRMLRRHPATLVQKNILRLTAALHEKIDAAYLAAGQTLKHHLQWQHLAKRAARIGLALPGPPAGAGGTGPVAPRPGPTAPAREPDGAKVELHFDRQWNVLPVNFQFLMEVFDADRLVPHRLREACGCLQLLFHGYQDEQRLPYTIPEIRQFAKQLRQAWPYAPFFCDLDGVYLVIEAFSQLQHFSVIDSDSDEQLGFTIRTDELQRYVTESHRIIRKLGKRAKMSRSEVAQRIQHFDEYIAAHCGQWNSAL